MSVSCHGIAETLRSSLTRTYVFFTVFVISVILHEVTAVGKLRSFQNVAVGFSFFSCSKKKSMVNVKINKIEVGTMRPVKVLIWPSTSAQPSMQQV